MCIGTNTTDYSCSTTDFNSAIGNELCATSCTTSCATWCATSCATSFTTSFTTLFTISCDNNNTAGYYFSSKSDGETKLVSNTVKNHVSKVKERHANGAL